MKNYNTDKPFFTDKYGQRVYQSGNDANNPNGMKIYEYKGRRVPAYSKKDVKNRYKFLYPNH